MRSVSAARKISSGYFNTQSWEGITFLVGHGVGSARYVVLLLELELLNCAEDDKSVAGR